ncbi:lysM and putative peptidoglycan-binding domain-containing protein 1-like [Sphaeramia orbicularis]|uniref:LysM and putative peptidoglycan-binding domain-containing protein 1 n=1 Tax=Sphaeramia orbicularis TaxID=375764 RepID=A0A673A6R3_9TELE|nr:lysM and putative peptidoglycan-binding domain-containing protein 1-like [Sphaeramia orbicularis]XP_030014733.1 lysM and putative peptidoglycan-binding domain-containing protein 1-like [Sphaeramia orbicularis]
MSGERASLPARGNGLLRGRQTKSYGSLVRSQLSPVRHRRIEHMIQPGETLAGLALKYGVTMEQIKRANRLYTNDSIFLKKSLSIPVMSCDLDGSGHQVGLAEEELEGGAGSGSEQNPVDCRDALSELTPGDFLKRLDGLISQSKHAAVKGCEEAEKRVAAFEAACSSGSRTSEWRPIRRSQSVMSPPRMQQKTRLLATPLTVTKLTKKLRDGEDEIFEL